MPPHTGETSTNTKSSRPSAQGKVLAAASCCRMMLGASCCCPYVPPRDAACAILMMSDDPMTCIFYACIYLLCILYLPMIYHFYEGRAVLRVRFARGPYRMSALCLLCVCFVFALCLLCVLIAVHCAEELTGAGGTGNVATGAPPSGSLGNASFFLLVGLAAGLAVGTVLARC
jgi:hypothetical protein